jgi:hypothetical protein
LSGVSALLVLSGAFSCFLVCRCTLCCLGFFYVGLFSVRTFFFLAAATRTQDSSGDVDPGPGPPLCSDGGGSSGDADPGPGPPLCSDGGGSSGDTGPGPGPPLCS